MQTMLASASGTVRFVVILWIAQIAIGLIVARIDHAPDGLPHGATALRSAACFGGLVPLPGVMLAIQIVCYIAYRLWATSVRRRSTALEQLLMVSANPSHGTVTSTRSPNPSGSEIAPVMGSCGTMPPPWSDPAKDAKAGVPW